MGQECCLCLIPSPWHLVPRVLNPEDACAVSLEPSQDSETRQHCQDLERCETEIDVLRGMVCVWNWNLVPGWYHKVISQSHSSLTTSERSPFSEQYWWDSGWREMKQEGPGIPVSQKQVQELQQHSCSVLFFLGTQEAAFQSLPCS